MNTKAIQPQLFKILLCLALLLGCPFLLWAQQEAASPLDLVVKITRIQETLDLIDDLAGMEPGQSPSAQLKGMLQGTDWMDPTRSIVIGLEFIAGQSQPKASLLVPFREANEGFRSTFNALPGPDYYLMSLPPGPGQDISQATKEALIAAATSESKGVLTMEMALSRLINAADAQIQAGLSNLDKIPPPEATKQFGPTPQDIKEAAMKMLDTAGQVEVLAMGLDLDKDRFATSFEVQAAPETKLAELFVESGQTSLLHSFKPDHQINFRYRSFDMAAVMGVIDDCFGDLYKKMGIDFSELAAICESFTGEMAGGISFGKEGMAMEVISVLKDTEATAAPDFLETVYVPWMAEYSQDVAAMIQQQTGTKMDPFFARTPESTVAGYKVIGMKTQFPYPQGPGAPGADQTLAWTAYEMRMTTVGNLLLAADTDEAIARLIDVAKTVKEQPAEGPLMTMDMDMGDYLDFLAQMMPQDAPPLPKLGRMVSEFDIKAGRASGSFAVMTKDIKTMIAQFKDMGQLAPAPEEAPAPAESPRERAEVEEKLPEPPEVDPATQQLHKGALCATYGNDKAAIAYYKRAIEMDPKNSNAYFQQGISLGELGRYKEAIASIDKAMDMGNRKGLYLYGRGRVYLLSGDEASAMEDFKAAAALDNRDAKEYLESTLQARR
ncbi:MAG: tetratricopeptide repeat protein [Thermodesulfobacteriota bacterium]|nr:tetratricopeptide repeat protein [Thermodesulfobacteriota bacterium]